MKRCVAAVLLLLYLAAWALQKNKAEMSDYYLSPPLPATVLKVAGGYAQQLMAFSLFVKVAIFAGGPLKGVDKMSYADSMAANFDVMTEMYPEFIDPYHYCESFLAPISPEYAQQANLILDRGVAAHPDAFYLQFFQAFNYYYYMNQPQKAADLFFILAKNPEAPSWFGHLAGMLMARGGNLIAGRTMLQAMLLTEKSEFTKERYRRGIMDFNRALKVQGALDRYREEHGMDAASLQELIPRYLDALPQLSENYVLVWKPPLLRLEQPGFLGAKEKLEK